MEYKNSCIYRLKIGEYLFYGASTKSLEDIFIMLKSHSTSSKCKNNKLYGAINSLGFENIELSILEHLICNSRQELNKRCWDIVKINKNYPYLLNTRFAK